MVDGHKDKDGKFHPHNNDKHGVSSKDAKHSESQNVDNSDAKDILNTKKRKQLRVMFMFGEDSATKDKLDREYDEFTSGITDFGSSDISTAVRKYLEVGLGGRELSDDVREWSESTGTDLNDVDICYVAYDRILQEARNEIDSVLGFDIANDIEGGTEFYVHGNYMASSYDYSSEAKKQLEDVLLDASKEDLTRLKNNVFVKSFLSDIDVFGDY